MMSDTIDLIVIAYRDMAQAGEIFAKLDRLQKEGSASVITAATLVKDYEGKTTTEASLDVAHKKGTRYGALAGGLLAIVAPPVGIAGLLIGTLGGAIVGRKLHKKPERNFTKDFLEEVLAEMQGGSSALVVLTESEAAPSTKVALAAFGGEVIHHELSAEALDQLARTSAAAQVAMDSTARDETAVAETKEVLRQGTRREGPLFERVLVIVNPASGQNETILNTLNTVFRATEVEWDIALTKKSGDASRLAQEAAAAGEVDVVAAYGGDGTVMEAAAGLIGSDVPLAILPGGTNNVMSVELGVPKALVDAAALIGGAPARIRPVDMGRLNDQLFILRVGIGYEAVINKTADREMKDRLGGFAYTLAGIKALKDPPLAHYKLTLDGQVEEIEGLWVMIANSASLGAPNLNLVQKIDVGDGLLDVIVVRQRDLDSLLSVVTSIADVEWAGKPLPHWQVREVTVEADPPMAVTGDGEIWDPTPLVASVIPQAVNILVPA
jgi:YegS/Rv2252/BmrU family lipid kinase